MSSSGRWLCSQLRRALPLVLDDDDVRRVAWPALADAEHEAEGRDPRAFRAALLGLLAAVGQAFLWRRGQRLRSGRWAGLAAVAIAALTGVILLSRSPHPALAASQLTFVALGLVLAVALATSERASLSTAARVIGPLSGALLLATPVIGVEQGGASRWIAVGPLTIQASLLLWPWIVLAVADAVERRPALASLLSGAAVLGLALQRDPTTAMVYGITLGVVALRAHRPVLAGGWVVSAAAAIAIGSLGPVDLPVVEEVERAWRLSATLGPGFVAMAALATLLAASSPWLASRRDEARLSTFSLGAGVALALFLVRPFVFAGEPVFFLGFSGSAVVGALSAAALAATGSVRASSPPRPRFAAR